MIALLQLLNAKGAGDATVRRLAAWMLRGEGTPDELLDRPAGEVAAALAVSEDVARSVLAERESAARLAETLDAQAIDIVWLGDAQYPERLKLILGDDAPPILFFKGNACLFKRPSVGFCGSRKASDKGLAITDQAARALATADVCVVSGYANGVDLAAHRGAMDAGGTTIMVLAEGIQRFHAKKPVADVLQPDNLVEYSEPAPSAEGNPFFLSRGGIPIRGNRQRMPNLDRVLETTRQPRWRIESTAAQLF